MLSFLFIVIIYLYSHACLVFSFPFCNYVLPFGVIKNNNNNETHISSHLVKVTIEGVHWAGIDCVLWQTVPPVQRSWRKEMEPCQFHSEPQSIMLMSVILVHPVLPFIDHVLLFRVFSLWPGFLCFRSADNRRLMQTSAVNDLSSAQTIAHIGVDSIRRITPRPVSMQI